MSSVNEESLEKFFSTRAATKVPAPWRRVSSPSLTSASSALRTVMRETLELLGEVALGRQRLVGGEAILGDRVAQGALQLLIQRRAPLLIEAADHVGERRQATGPFKTPPATKAATAGCAISATEPDHLHTNK